MEYPLVPDFTTDFNAYYTRVPNPVESVNLLVDSTYYELVPQFTTDPSDGSQIPVVDGDGNQVYDQVAYNYTITINNRPAESGVYFTLRDLVVGDNEVVIVLTDRNGAKKAYTVVINRADAETEEPATSSPSWWTCTPTPSPETPPIRWSWT